MKRLVIRLGWSCALSRDSAGIDDLEGRKGKLEVERTRTKRRKILGEDGMRVRKMGEVVLNLETGGKMKQN